MKTTTKQDINSLTRQKKDPFCQAIVKATGKKCTNKYKGFNGRKNVCGVHIKKLKPCFSDPYINNLLHEGKKRKTIKKIEITHVPKQLILSQFLHGEKIMKISKIEDGSSNKILTWSIRELNKSNLNSNSNSNSEQIKYYGTKNQSFNVNNKIIHGHYLKIHGNHNKIVGDHCMITGNHNQIKGNGHTILGNHNVSQDCSGSEITGNWNNIIGNNNQIYGDYNFIPENSSGNLVVGNKNTCNNQLNTIQQITTINDNNIESIFIKKSLEITPELIEFPEKIDNEPLLLENNEYEQLCIICMERSIKTCIIPCGHSCICVTCSLDLKNRNFYKCPLCNKTYSRIQRIFKQ